MAVSPARSAAFEILLRVERESSYASELLNSAKYASLLPADHALATQLVMGALRWLSKLDSYISHVSAQPLNKLDTEVLVALRLGLYQLHWLDRIPARAAINESVEIVKRSRKKSAAPFVNAVLRKLSQRISESDAVVEPDGSAEAIAGTYAHPVWMVERWVREFGPSVARKICIHNQATPMTSIRLRTTDAIERLEKEGIVPEPGNFLSTARTLPKGEIPKSKLLQTGIAILQEEASQLVAALVGMDPTKTGARVLDCCAAPAGKTLAIADQNPTSYITGLEIHPHRARLMRSLLNRHTNSHPPVRVVVADARHCPLSIQFDRVLADVPCSGTGTLSRNPEIKWRLRPDDISALRLRQIEILRSAVERVAPGGRLIYSTCSLEPEENEQVVQSILDENKSIRPVACRMELDHLKARGDLVWSDPESLVRGPYLRTVPGLHPCDGFFAAILQRV